jgi:biopolymer transport protein ExbB/TolQ
VFELVQAGGWLMIPILLCSVISAAICGERFWTLRSTQIVPKNLLAQVWNWIKSNEMDNKKLRELRAGSPLGQILATAAGLTVAIPSLFFYRFFQRKVDDLVISMEQEALKLVEVLNTDRHEKTDRAAKSDITQTLS